MTARTLTAGVALMALVPTATRHVTGQDSTKPRATVEFRVVATPSSYPTYPAGTFGHHLTEGEATRASMQVNLASASEGTPCTSGVTMDVSGEPRGPFPFWQVEATLRRARMDDILVAYKWERRTGDPSVTPSEGKGEVTLTEHGRALLDYVPVLDTTAGCFRNVALELTATIPEDPVFADRRIAYDLWLVRENDGKRFTRRLQLIGKQGENVAFDYGRFRSQLHGVPPPKGSTATHYIIEMAVSGTVRGRIQPDGSVELFLVAHRSARPAEGHWATAAHGDKRVQATPGETVQLELPAPTHFEGANDGPEMFLAIAEQRVSLVLTPTLVE